jgi:hypothetical protein
MVFTEFTAKKFQQAFDLALGKYDPDFLSNSRKLLELIMLR